MSLTATTTVPSSARRSVLLWLPTFVAFPLGGLATMLLVGPVDGPAAAVLGGLLTGAVLGTAQATSLRRTTGVPGGFAAWVAATAVGLAAGLAVGSDLVDFRTDLGDLVLQGVVSGAGVGLLQGLLLSLVVGRRAVAAWPAYLAATWALGWAVTTGVGVQVEEQFSVFGAAGALTVTVLTSVLPLLATRRTATR